MPTSAVLIFKPSLQHAMQVMAEIAVAAWPGAQLFHSVGERAALAVCTAAAVAEEPAELHLVPDKALVFRNPLHALQPAHGEPKLEVLSCRVALNISCLKGSFSVRCVPRLVAPVVVIPLHCDARVRSPGLHQGPSATARIELLDIVHTLQEDACPPFRHLRQESLSSACTCRGCGGSGAPTAVPPCASTLIWRACPNDCSAHGPAAPSGSPWLLALSGLDLLPGKMLGPSSLAIASMMLSWSPTADNPILCRCSSVRLFNAAPRILCFRKTGTTSSRPQLCNHPDTSSDVQSCHCVTAGTADLGELL
mmetsp:Transcript_48427/g.138394  ORF Transcript_48427/g.138394 Transcript_48427/m.138394 type:complete len:308 (-) Transcript_48427:463-1386(-)